LVVSLGRRLVAEDFARLPLFARVSEWHAMTAEQIRLEEARAQKVPWKKWGPYLSERQWGTVRED
jgi:hypothetical protein